MGGMSLGGGDWHDWERRAEYNRAAAVRHSMNPRHDAFDIAHLAPENPAYNSFLYKGLKSDVTRANLHCDAYCIMFYAFQGSVTALASLLSITKSSLPDFATDDGFTPLMAAAVRGHDDVVALLAKNPLVNLDRQTADGWTALHYAAWFGREDCVATLLKHHADFNLTASGKTAFDIAKNESVKEAFFGNKRFSRLRPKPAPAKIREARSGTTVWI